MKKIFFSLGLTLNVCFAIALPKQILNINDKKMSYYKIGQGKPVVLLMGYGLTHNFWTKPFIECLSQNHTLYILDYLDESSIDLMAMDVNNFIQKTELDHPEVIGWSMGGGVALSLANKYPHVISKIGLLSTVIADPGLPQVVLPYQAVTNSTNEKLDYVFGNNIYGYNSKELNHYKSGMLDKNAMIFVNSDTLERQKNALAKWVADEENYNMIGRIKVPANIVIADHDAILNPQVELYGFRNYTNAKITVIDNSGHASFYQYPKQVCKAVLY